MTAIDTIKGDMELAWSTNATLTATLADFRVSTQTVPVSNATELFVLQGPPPNGVIVMPALSSSGGTGTLRVFGFASYAAGSGNARRLWWKGMLLASYSITCGATADTAMNGTSLYGGITFTKTYGDGKSYEASATEKIEGGVAVDCWHFTRVGIALNANSMTGNMLVGVW